MHLPWLDLVAALFGAVWLITGFVGSSGAGRDLNRRGVDPRAVGPAMWVQRILGFALLVLGVFGLLHR